MNRKRRDSTTHQARGVESVCGGASPRRLFLWRRLTLGCSGCFSVEERRLDEAKPIRNGEGFGGLTTQDGSLDTPCKLVVRMGSARGNPNGEGARSAGRSELAEGDPGKSRFPWTERPAARYRPAARPRSPPGPDSSRRCGSAGRASGNRHPPHTGIAARASQGLWSRDLILDGSSRGGPDRSGNRKDRRDGPTDGCNRRELPWATARQQPRASAMLRLRSLPIDDRARAHHYDRLSRCSETC